MPRHIVYAFWLIAAFLINSQGAAGVETPTRVGVIIKNLSNAKHATNYSPIQRAQNNCCNINTCPKGDACNVCCPGNQVPECGCFTASMVTDANKIGESFCVC